ncbi:type II secretion system F family protein [Fulvimarina sp. 2208YS6-2-32]|uniref:Type II secretion system F family protein n=1 Tax=Fulvimarina uroteuthidis TaxID=3098149 RepID=A0ABU5I406_9HYPH|nr:type II secretion system F family protein [Fulvimarina sp. 2208YS6-2-32]MDY8110119.1 type II secretion system F family protein [Fulvimarina sp. 2208YS6-2-32]
MIAGLDPAYGSLLVVVLASVSVCGLLYVFTAGNGADEKLYRDRFAAIADAGAPSIEAGQPGSDQTRRKRSVEATLKEAEEKRKATNANKTVGPSLVQRMRQAELPWSRTTYVAISFGVGIAALAVFLAAGLVWYAGLGFAIAAGLLGPHGFVGFKRGRRLRKFGDAFPSAVDVVVRGVKSGLPLPDCLRIIATEMPEPVRSEFRTVVEDQTIGVPIDEALSRLAERIPLTETSFFSIVIGVQGKTGGSLAEALGNLSKVLRERKKMESKIRSMSQEAKTSGSIIGALPIIVGLLVFFTSPDFIAIMFTDMIGNIVLAGSAIWMATGIFVMKKMISFDF